MTIRTKLTIRFSVLVASILLAFTLAIYYFYAQYREREFYSRLQEKAYTTAQLLTGINGIDPEFLRAMDRNQLTALFAEEVTIYNRNNEIIYDSGNEPFPLTPGLLKSVHSGKVIQVRNHETEVIAIPFKEHNRNLVVVVSAIDKWGFSKLSRLRYILVTGWIISVSCTILAGRYFAGEALSPISSIVSQVQGISASNINARLDIGNSKDELAALSQTFNDMLTRLEEAFTLQKSFVSHASHELRTPLALITSQIEVSRMQARTADEYQEALDYILEEVRNMTKLSNNLLELARVNADAATIPMVRVRIDDLLWQARTELLRKSPSWKIIIEFADLPEREEDLIVTGNAMLLKMAFANLMENSCKYSTDQQVRVTIRNQSAFQLEIVIADRGMGISAHDLPHIFEPFYRSSQTGHLNGHGIGLTLTHRILDIHQCNIQFNSVIGEGTTVTVRLPLALAPEFSQVEVVS